MWYGNAPVHRVHNPLETIENNQTVSDLLYEVKEDTNNEILECVQYRSATIQLSTLWHPHPLRCWFYSARLPIRLRIRD